MDVTDNQPKLRSYWDAFNRKHGPAGEKERHAFACGFRAGVKAQKELTAEWQQFKANLPKDTPDPAEATHG